MPKIHFTYDQDVIQTFRASCEVPDGAEDWDEAKLKEHIYEHSDAWTENGEAINTEFGDTRGKADYIIEDFEGVT